MRVKCFIQTIQEVEISDEFKKLAVPYQWESGAKEEDFDNCIKAVKEATGLPWYNGESDTFIFAVHSVENGEVMLE